MRAIASQVAVHAWPGSIHLALRDLRSARALTVIGVASPETTIRHVARIQIRAAVCEAVAALLGRAVDSITLISPAGQPAGLAVPDSHIRLSISHAEGLSVAAIQVGAPVGVDVMRVEPGVDAIRDWDMLARDYLGPQVRARLARVAHAERSSAFAQEWTQWEARLKCLGRALTEWTPALEQSLASCGVLPLALPNNYCGALSPRWTG